MRLNIISIREYGTEVSNFRPYYRVNNVNHKLGTFELAVRVAHINMANQRVEYFTKSSYATATDRPVTVWTIYYSQIPNIKGAN